MRSPRVVINKAERTLEVLDGDTLMARMRVALGREPVGPKLMEGDGRTPEGLYRACSRNEKSKYHLAVGLDYPNREDAVRRLAQGRISQGQHDLICAAIAEGKRPPWDTPLGGEIMIHGGGSDADWTAGCIAVDDECMDYLWEHVPTGTEIRIEPRAEIERRGA